MENKKKNEELQSRREFFKKAAKGALPILGAIMLAGAPQLSKAAKAMGCTIDACTGTCMGTCKGTCRTGCQATCYHGCYSKCYGSR